jgi:hypothetical protein
VVEELRIKSLLWLARARSRRFCPRSAASARPAIATTSVTGRATLVSAQKERGVAMPPNCTVTWISYAGDEGGIVYRVEADIVKTDAVLVSITHLRFDPRPPLTREIIAYQKHRGKRLRLIPGTKPWRSLGGSAVG